MKDAANLTVSVLDILQKKSVPELRELAKGHMIKGFSKLRKPELVEAVTASLTDPGFLEELLYVLDEPTWSLFRRAAASKRPVRVGAPASLKYCFLADLGYLHVTGQGDAQVCTVPEEVKEVFRTLADGRFLRRKARYDLLHQYAEAAVNLYGAISLDDFIALFNGQNARKTNMDEVLHALIRHITIDSGYCFWDEYVVDTAFEDNDFVDVRDLFMQVGDKPRYIPEKEEFLRYSDWDYFEYNDEARRLEEYLVKGLGVPMPEAPQIITELHYACAVEAPFQERFQVLAEHDVSFDDAQLDELVPLLSNFSNSTRLWSNNGHTPNEIFHLYERQRLLPLPNQGRKQEKIGRNDPCPCGSGKKYKKCCGR